MYILNELSVIIVNYRSVPDIIACLESAFQFESAHSFEWIIVNNDEADPDGHLVTSRYPSVKWMNMGYNAGFARANNKGIREADGDIVLLLNPDTIILEDSIEKCFRRLQASEYVAAAVQLLNENHSTQITGNFFMKGGLNHLLPLPYIGAFLRKIAFTIGTKKTNIQRASDEEKVDWISGAFLMVKKSAIDKAGLLDEDFFLYSEEIEWCSRLGKQGELCVYGDLFTVHLQGETVNKIMNLQGKGYMDLTGKKGLQLMVSQHLRIRKQFGKGWFLFHLFMYTLEIPVLFIFSFIENLFRLKNPFKDWGMAISYSENVAKIWALSGRILGNRRYFYKMF
jgi:hypothetical protein